MRPLAKSALAYIAIALALYAGLYATAELLARRAGHSNPFHKIAVAERSSYDWLVLDASHAMPLDFGGSNAAIERETGLTVLNLASPGTGPLYNRFVLEAFLRQHRAARLLYVVDAFAFTSAAWNEDRFADAKLLRGMPLDAGVASLLVRYVRDDGVDPVAVLDYVTGFSKVNNRDRFRIDAWEGEAQFERVYRPSPASVRKRVAYLYPSPASPVRQARYLAAFAGLLDIAQRESMRVVVIRMPVPSDFRAALPVDAPFEASLRELLDARGIALHDFSRSLDEPRYYFDTDHLNRDGVAAFVRNDLRALLAGEAALQAGDRSDR